MNMHVKAAAVRQYQAIVDMAAQRLKGLPPAPPEGWIATVRKALGMSGAQLAARLGVTRARVSQAERAEAGGGITLRTMQEAAEAMGCRFVYAIVPDGAVEEVILARARRQARAVVERAARHMALEDQALPAARNAEEVERIARDFVRTLPRDLWADK